MEKPLLVEILLVDVKIKTWVFRNMEVKGERDSSSSSIPSTTKGDHHGNEKPRIIMAASGSVAAIKFGIVAESLCEWAEVKAVATKSALHFIDKMALPVGLELYTDEDEWSSWKKIGDNVLHIELRKWADAMVIAPLSANTLAKVILCSFLLVILELEHRLFCCFSFLFFSLCCGNLFNELDHSRECCS